MPERSEIMYTTMIKVTDLLFCCMIILHIASGGLLNEELKCSVHERVDECPTPCVHDRCPVSRAETLLTCGEAKRSLETKCHPACVCIFNYRRMYNRTCIPARDCPAVPCADNEQFESCPLWCASELCKDRALNKRCPPSTVMTLMPCMPGCRCQAGYFRHTHNGPCVPIADCVPGNKPTSVKQLAEKNNKF